MLFSAVALVGCGSTVDGPEHTADAGGHGGDGAELADRLPTEHRVEGIHLREGIKIVRFSEDETAGFESEGPRTIRLTGVSASAAESQGLDRWDLVFGPDFAFQVASWKRDGDDFVVEPDTFDLVDVIHGEWDETFRMRLRRPTSDADEQTGGQPLRRRRQPAKSSLIDLDGELTAGDFASLEVGSGYKIKEFDTSYEFKVPVAVNYEFRGRIGEFEPGSNYRCEGEVQKTAGVGYCIDQVSFKATLKPQAEVTFETAVGKSVEFEVESDNLLGDLPSSQIPLGSTGLSLGVRLFARVGAEANINGNVSIDARFDGEAELPVGFNYDGTSTELTKAKREPESDPHFEVEGSVGYDAGAYVEAGLKFGLEPTAGNWIRLQLGEIGASLGPHVWYTPDPNRKNCLRYGLYFMPSITFEVVANVLEEQDWAPEEFKGEFELTPEAEITPNCGLNLGDWCILAGEGFSGEKCPGEAASRKWLIVETVGSPDPLDDGTNDPKGAEFDSIIVSGDQQDGSDGTRDIARVLADGWEIDKEVVDHAAFGADAFSCDTPVWRPDYACKRCRGPTAGCRNERCFSQTCYEEAPDSNWSYNACSSGWHEQCYACDESSDLDECGRTIFEPESLVSVHDRLAVEFEEPLPLNGRIDINRIIEQEYSGESGASITGDPTARDCRGEPPPDIADGCEASGEYRVYLSESPEDVTTAARSDVFEQGVDLRIVNGKLKK